MASIQNPTYMLAPNWTFRPGGPISLGNIIVDPFKPHRVLTRPDPQKPQAPIETVTEKNWRLHLGTNRNLDLGLWAQFLQTIGVEVGTKHGKTISTDYTMESLETVYFRDEPLVEEIKERVKDFKLRKLMRLDSFLSKPVYMITGIKVAKCFGLSAERSLQRAGNVGASVPVTAEISVGAGVGVSVEASRKDGFQSVNDIVFAYQLLKIIPKGWREKTLETKEYQSRATFLSNDYKDEEDDIEVESSFATAAELAKAGKGKVDLTEVDINDGESEYVCILFRGE